MEHTRVFPAEKQTQGRQAEGRTDVGDGVRLKRRRRPCHPQVFSQQANKHKAGKHEHKAGKQRWCAQMSAMASDSSVAADAPVLMKQSAKLLPAVPPAKALAAHESPAMMASENASAMAVMRCASVARASASTAKLLPSARTGRGVGGLATKGFDQKHAAVGR